MSKYLFPLEDGPQHLLTPLQRKILRMTQDHVQRGTKGGFICNIIRHLNEVNGNEIGAFDTSCRGLLKRINMALGNEPYTDYGETAGSWVCQRLYEDIDADDDEYKRKMKLTRLAWIDYMLENW